MKVYDYRDDVKKLKKEFAANFDLPKYLKSMCVEGWRCHTIQRGYDQAGNSIWYFVFEKETIIIE